MKKDKTNKIIAILYYLAAVCFYITMIINFIDKEISNAIVFLCVGSVFIFLGSMYLKKYKKEKDKISTIIK